MVQKQRDTADSTSSVLQATQVLDLARVRRLVSQEPLVTTYLLGDLDPVFAPFCSWYVASKGGQDEAVVLVYTGLSLPAVLTYGSEAGVAAIFREFGSELPARAHAHLWPEHVEVARQGFQFEHPRSMMRMGAPLESVNCSYGHASACSLYSDIEVLGHRHTGQIIELFTHYPDNFFEPHQLSTGHYYGIRHTPSDTLVAVAGVHVASRQEKVAALGNIVTHPEHRGKGLSTRVTAHLCQALAKEGIAHAALNVDQSNRSAIRVYEKLGFSELGIYLETFISRRLGEE